MTFLAFLNFCELPLPVVLLSWLLPFLCGLGLGFALWNRFKKQVEDLEGRIRNYKRDITDLEGKLVDCKHHGTELDSEIALLKGRIREKDMQISTLESSLEAAKNTATTSSTAAAAGFVGGAIAGSSDKEDPFDIDPDANDNEFVEELEEAIEHADDQNEAFDEATSSIAGEFAGEFSEAIEHADDDDGDSGAQGDATGGSEAASSGIAAMTGALAGEMGADKDDLTKIEGIGPKVEGLLNGSDIQTYASLADSDVPHLKGILEEGGSRYKMMNPGTWPRQAALARDGKWDELNKWQDELDGGVEVIGASKKSAKDDLTKIEGIGPKVEGLLNGSDIQTYASLADSDVPKLKGVLEGGGSRYKMMNPGTWPRQAALARDGKWDELNKWQDELDGGVEVAAKSSGKKDDLKKVEGIGPKIEGLMNDAGIYTFAELASSSIERLKKILDDAGPRYRIAKPDTWPQQAALARDGKWDELNDLQDNLKGGRA